MNLPENVTRIMGRTKLVLTKNMPHICVYSGTIGLVAAGVWACYKTLELPSLMDERDKNLALLQKAKDEEMALVETEDGSMRPYTDEEFARYSQMEDVVFLKSAIKLYAPAVILGAVSVALIFTGHHMQTKRLRNMTAALSATMASLEQYRTRVRDAVGEEKERDIWLDRAYTEQRKETTDPETGEVKEETTQFEEAPGTHSPYARYFDETSSFFHRDAHKNKAFLIQSQHLANELLQSRGHLYLNEVFDMLDLPRTREGSVVGWIANRPGEPTVHVDFGMYNCSRTGRYNTLDEFVADRVPEVLLDFNVTGVIFDKI